MAYRSSAIASAATGAISAAPIGVQVGDYLCGLFVVDSATSTVTPPSGWAQQSSAVLTDETGVYADKIATGSDLFSFNDNTANARALVTVAFSGRDTANPLSTTPVTTINNVANATTPGFTATYNGITALQGDDVAVFFFTDQSDAGERIVSTQITNYTERADGVNQDWVSGIGVDTRDNVNAGATGNLTATLSDNASLARTAGYGAVVVAIKVSTAVPFIEKPTLMGQALL